MDLKISELIDVPKIQKLTDSFYEATGIPSAVVANDGIIVTKTGWTDICTQYHRKNPITEERCLKSNSKLRDRLKEGQPHVIYKCPNGLIDAAAPIVIADELLAYVITGQFLFEKPSAEVIDFFKKQAKEVGFDESVYLKALSEVPVISEKRVKPILNFLSDFAGLLAELGFNRLKQMEASEAVQKTQAQLENRVWERTAELWNSNEMLKAEISERKQAEAALKESRRSWQSIVNNAVIGIYQVSDVGKFILVNPRLADIFGFKSPDDFMVSVHNISELYINPEDRPPILHEMNTKGFVDGAEARFRHKDGQAIWIRISARAIQDASGETVYEGFMLDVTDVKRAQRALQKSELWVRNIFASLNEAVFVITPERVFSDMNEAALDMLGYTREELLNRPSDIAHVDHEHYLEFGRKLEQGIKKEGVANLQFRLRRKNGDIFPSEHTITPMIDETGKTIGMVSVVRDLSEQKKMEEEKQRLEAQLQQSQKMEAIGTLAGGIAHDFNNILGIIIGNTELAIDDVPEWNPAKECLQEIRKASMRAKDVVRHILSFARKTMAERKPIQIGTIIKDSLILIRASIPATIEIRQNIACASEMILADPTEINQILMNLCTNASHAMPDDGDVLEVSLEAISLDKASVSQYEDLATGNYVKLTVKDSGQGIDPEIMDRIFDPYFTTKDVGKGTGMGLSVVYGIVKKNEGAIKVKSEFGKGTIVEVVFPLVEQTPKSEEKEESRTLPGGTECILFVDDEKSLAKMAEQMLKRLGYEVVSKTNPKDALALFKAEPNRFDLVMTDMAMPQLAGDRLAHELMKIRQDIPVIICTGHSDRIDKDKAKKLGIKAYTMKPLVMRDLADTVRNALDK